MANGRARDIRKQSFWRKAVEQQQASGLPVIAWCREHTVNASQFFFWRRELTRRDAEQTVSFVPVHVSDHSLAEQASRIEIVLAGGRCIRISGRVDRQMLADVLAVMEGQAC